MEPAERRKVSLMQALATIRNEKVAIRKESALRRKTVRDEGEEEDEKKKKELLHLYGTVGRGAAQSGRLD